VTPGGEESYGYQRIMPMMHNLEPDKVGEASMTFGYLADSLDSLRTALKTMAGQLAQNESWQGTAAQSAMSKFQQLHDQAAQLSAQSRTTSNTLNWLGNEVMNQYKAIPSPQVASGLEQDISKYAQATSGAGLANEMINGAPDGNSKADTAAQDYLKTFNGHLQTANNAMPKSLASPNPNAQASGSPGSAPGDSSSSGGSSGSGSGSGAGYSGVPGSSAPGGGGTTGHSASSSPSVNPFSSSHLPSGHGGASSNASLQGYSPPSGGTAGSPFGSGGSNMAGGGANPFDRVAAMPGGFGPRAAGGASGEDGVPGEEGALKAGKGGLPGEGENIPGESGASSGAGDAEGAAGAGGEAAGAEAAGASGAEGAEGGASGMPMGAGGGGGSQDKERQRQAWMNEDQNIWGLPDDEIGSTLE